MSGINVLRKSATLEDNPQTPTNMNTISATQRAVAGLRIKQIQRTGGLVATTPALHAEGRQLDPGSV